VAPKFPLLRQSRFDIFPAVRVTLTLPSGYESHRGSTPEGTAKFATATKKVGPRWSQCAEHFVQRSMQPVYSASRTPVIS